MSSSAEKRLSRCGGSAPDDFQGKFPHAVNHCTQIHLMDVLKNTPTMMCRMPVQYIIEEWDFRDLTLKMRPPVFIPRLETEVRNRLHVTNTTFPQSEIIEIMKTVLFNDWFGAGDGRTCAHGSAKEIWTWSQFRISADMHGSGLWFWCHFAQPAEESASGEIIVCYCQDQSCRSYMMHPVMISPD